MRYSSRLRRQMGPIAPFRRKNQRGTFFVSRKCVPYLTLTKSANIFWLECEETHISSRQLEEKPKSFLNQNSKILCVLDTPNSKCTFNVLCTGCPIFEFGLDPSLMVKYWDLTYNRYHMQPTSVWENNFKLKAFVWQHFAIDLRLCEGTPWAVPWYV